MSCFRDVRRGSDTMDEPIYNFGVEIGDSVPDERYVVAWPIRAWRCYIPENLSTQGNVLERLYLSLIENGLPNVKGFLVKKLQFNPELVDVIDEKCRDNGYIDKRYKDGLHLSKEGKELITDRDPRLADYEKSENSIKVYMFQDAVTGRVVPCFDRKELPDYYEKIEQCLRIPYSAQYRRPKVAEINNELRTWLRLVRDERTDFASSVPDEYTDADAFTDEVAWEDIDENGEIASNESPKDPVGKSEQNIDVDYITVFDDRPELYYAKAYLRINRDDPAQTEILSPFGYSTNLWFTNRFRRIRLSDTDIDNCVAEIIKDRTNILSMEYAFNNDYNIELFNVFPWISNDNEYKDIKKAIIDLKKSHDRIISGEDDTSNFQSAMRRATEMAINLVLKKNSQLVDVVNRCSDEWDYKGHIDNLWNASRIDDKTKRAYRSTKIYQNMKSQMFFIEKQNKYSFGTRDAAAVLLLNADFNSNQKAVQLLFDDAEIFFRLNEIAEEGNKSNHGGAGFANNIYSEVEAEHYYVQYEKIVRSLFNHFLSKEK